MKKVEDLFLVDVFQNVKIIAGHAGVKRVVESIEISETPDVIHFLAENALLLTTGFAFKEDPSALYNLIAELSEYPCAGVAIKLKRFIDEVPQNVIDLANAKDFPIMKIPESLTLGTVAHQLLSFIWNHQIEELTYAIHVHKRFTNMMIKGYTLQSLIDNIGFLIKCPVLLLDPIGDIASFSKHFQKEDMKNIMNKTEEIIKKKREPFQVQKRFSIPDPNKEGDYISARIFHVKTMHPYPYLLIIFYMDKLSHPSSPLAIEQASTVISFTLLKNEAIRENSRMLENNFFTSLVDGNITNRQEIIHRGKQHGLLDNQKYACIVCKMDEEKQDPFSQNTEMMNRLYDYLNRFLDKSILKADAKNLVFMKDEFFVILMQCPKDLDDPLKNKIEEWLKEFQREAFSSLNISLSFGVGNFFNDIAYIPITYKEAVNAWEDGAELFRFSFINFYETKQLQEMIRLIPEENLLKFYENTLRSLSYPQNKDEESLLNTLMVYLDHNCEIAITARKLYVHRNTVKYRIAKCEEMLGYPIEDSQNSLNLRMALLMRSMFTEGK
ncbi:PucR family transcriptional regulator ligand-binding domain-containing protein [Siminovitchia sp. FSL H7-0308]|uniref:Purine catabolism regulator n=1 Tax=Siminovitchia thermophila TaxID=1245522 RepID=A0ABS2R0F1_9BACI|nr:PucR family transcriptional regulator [Siminovitchia thermophila]MBM7713112.1 purine catabolism regulator [Siminovitchia thermophila]ONK24856.1 hypothetical protein BLX87_03205 [Bacillus sp. VT-16-64]